MNDLKAKTMTESNIIQTDDGYFRFKNDSEKLLTAGFSTKDLLFKCVNHINFDVDTIEIMNRRYFLLNT